MTAPSPEHASVVALRRELWLLGMQLQCQANELEPTNEYNRGYRAGLAQASSAILERGRHSPQTEPPHDTLMDAIAVERLLRVPRLVMDEDPTRR
jgi:hypothetical protein